MENNKVEQNTEDDEMKLLSGLIPAQLYWDFKRVAVLRKETLKDALKNAALLYIDVEKVYK
jgi:hypothetical protein